MIRLTVKDLSCRRSVGVWLIEGLSFTASPSDILTIEGLDISAGAALADVTAGQRS